MVRNRKRMRVFTSKRNHLPCGAIFFLLRETNTACQQDKLYESFHECRHAISNETTVMTKRQEGFSASERFVDVASKVKVSRATDVKAGMTAKGCGVQKEETKKTT